MRLWPRKAREDADERPAEDASPPERTPETQRAVEAAQAAAIDLHKARQLRTKIDRTADRIDAETGKNGWRMLIREALGSGP